MPDSSEHTINSTDSNISVEIPLLDDIELPETTISNDTDVITGSQAPSEGQIDSTGIPYDSAIHLPKRTSKGAWRKKKQGSDPADLNATEAKSLGKAMAFTYTQGHVIIFGESGLTKELVPALEHSFERYALEKGIKSFPVEIELALSCGSYTLATAAKPENIDRTRKFFISPLKKLFKKLLGKKE